MKTLIFIFNYLFFEFTNSLLISMAIIIGVLILLFLFERYVYNKKINKIIKSYKDSKKKEGIKPKEKKPTTKGWGMNDSPFRERKSGLTWGGGNIKGASAKRGKRKTFLK